MDTRDANTYGDGKVALITCGAAILIIGFAWMMLQIFVVRVSERNQEIRTRHAALYDSFRQIDPARIECVVEFFGSDIIGATTLEYSKVPDLETLLRRTLLGEGISVHYDEVALRPLQNFYSRLCTVRFTAVDNSKNIASETTITIATASCKTGVVGESCIVWDSREFESMIANIRAATVAPLDDR